MYILHNIYVHCKWQPETRGGGGGGENDTLETKTLDSFTLNLAILSIERSTTVIN